MAVRNRDQPDIRARISIHDESPNDIKEQLQIADQTQRALRLQQSWHPPSDTPEALHRAVLRKTRTLPYPHRLGHFNDLPLSDALPCPLNRSNSLNSLSTLHREAEAAALSLYRDSPISALSPIGVDQTWRPNVEYEPQDPCPPRPPLRVETLSQQRKYQKMLKKSLKKKEKEQLKAQKEDEQLRRAFLAAEVAATRRKDALARGETLPLRSKSTKSIASQVVKSLSPKRPLSKLSRRVKKEKSDPPTLDDFDSKQEVHEYLNPPTSTSAPPAIPSVEIAELPAELPQYTPFQDSTRTQDNEPVALLEDVPLTKSKEDISLPRGNDAKVNHARSTPRSMRCDSCQSPIRLNQIYYHCSICENGDRILCSSCDQAGWSCRHEITEKVRSVSRSGPSQGPSSCALHRERSRAEAQEYAAAMWGLSVPDFPVESSRGTEPPLHATMSAVSPWTYSDIMERKKSKLKPREKNGDSSEKSDELEFRRREQDMVIREKEVTLREREAAIREQQASLREQEAALSIRQQMFALQLQSSLGKLTQEVSIGVGAQFQDLSQNDCIRTHATKRKAGGGQAPISPSNSTGSNRKSSLKRSPSGGHDPNDEDEDGTGAGSPKKAKQENDATPEKLFACPFCKFDKSRYSEQNVLEKHYRGCSSGYWPDISRLKQHLYRVHWRRIHCGRCYTKFETKEALERHVYALQPCTEVECPYPEKFNDQQYNEIRRKRPANTPEQVWYTIYGILFPGEPQPSSPYADNVNLPPPSALSPTAAPECQLDVLGEVFESRLDQYIEAPGHAWLRSPETREFIRQQLRASMTDVLQRLRPTNSPSVGNPSVEVSPYSAVAPDSARRSSISLTPASSIPPSPINGPGSLHKSVSDTHFLLPSRRQSFSRPLPARTAQKCSAEQSRRSAQHDMQEAGEASTGVTFPVPLTVDPENDRYDEKCNSWSHGDELGLAISADFDFGFNPTFSSAVEELNQTHSTPALPLPTTTDFTPVRFESVEDNLTDPNSTIPSQLKPSHSTTSSVDSGYGSLGHASSSASTWPSSTSSKPNLNKRPVRDQMKGKRKREVKEPSPAPESAINYNALEIPFHEFSGGDLNLDMDEFGNIAGESLSAYLDT
ncbi:uncharacterized protein Z518_03651 [Rhinocladiella mackenziei CBS 650.93]|uniref:C2H2-type domain-containing protein n=1 Tax=Rhinocladiella mackenziei CBS 650.93 TaxID=1442369 RepID=A0A0D2IIU8_9EURO|nr:uncharacterized protein Z518_03651 [Rhinocladiella mackenziei CBS 650.93]KIX05679.1 hypothetical protein Z518_03651 [Rhinocladiella mackenziei CBS 650.93]